MDSFWNATNIVVNVLIAIVSAMIAWKVAKVNTNAKTLSYRVSMYPILDYKFQSKNGGVPLKEIKIMYNGAVLPNPCLVLLEITNTGNKGIENPPILISNNEEIEMIPLEIENVPKGFIWKIESENEYSCKISASILLYMILQNIFFFGFYTNDYSCYYNSVIFKRNTYYTYCEKTIRTKQATDSLLTLF